MAAGAFIVTNQSMLDVTDNTFDLDNDSWYAVLVLDTYTPSVATDLTYANISANECADGDYAPLDVVLTTSESSGTVKVDATDLSFGATVTITAKYVYLLRGDEAAPNASDEILGYCDLDSGGGSATATAGTFSITWSANGIYNIDRA